MTVTEYQIIGNLALSVIVAVVAWGGAMIFAIWNVNKAIDRLAAKIDDYRRPGSEAPRSEAESQ
jgi:uncharacterized protein involved in cysteine biosynthesis